MERNTAIKDKLTVFQRVLLEIPEVRYLGDPVLRADTEKVNLDEGVKIGHKLGGVLLKYRKISGYGRGLAAPQIGINKSVFVTFVDEKIEIFMNPSIVDSSEGRNHYKELCLSTGIISADVSRPEIITMRWTDVQGVIQTHKYDGFKSRLYQHEEEHLRGKLAVDMCLPGDMEICTFDPLLEKIRTSK